MAEEERAFRRRASDYLPGQTDEEILELIRQAKDDTEKAALMVLFQINKSLTHNTAVTIQIAKRQESHELEFANHRKEFIDHISAEQALFNKGIGAWKAVAFTAIGLAALGGYILTGYVNMLTKESTRNDLQEQRLIRMETAPPISKESANRLSVLEAQMTANTGLLIDLQHRFDDELRAAAREHGARRVK